MQTLTFQFQKPGDGDKGSVFFPALEDNIQQVNDHFHDGVTSKKLDAGSIEGVTTTLLTANWVLNGAGNGYYQDVALPAGYAITKYRLYCSDVDGNPVLAKIDYQSGTTYRVTVNLNTIDIVVMFVS